MKKLNGKLFVCAILAAAMASMTAVSAGAITYGGGAAPTTTTPPSTTTTTATATEETVTVLTDTAVSNAVADAAKAGKTEVTVKMTQDASGKTTVQESAIAEIAKGKVTVKVEVTSITGISYTAVIDPAKITEAKALDLTMAIIPGGDGVTVGGFDVPAGNIVIAPNQHGEFGAEVAIVLPAAVLANVDASSRLYYIDDDGNVTKMPKSAFKMNADGTGTVFMSHASQYVLSAIDLTKLAAQLSDEDDFDDDDDDAFLDDDVEADDDDDDVANEEDFVVDGAEDDGNPGTGVALALGALAASAAAVAITAKKRK